MAPRGWVQLICRAIYGNGPPRYTMRTISHIPTTRLTVAKTRRIRRASGRFGAAHTTTAPIWSGPSAARANTLRRNGSGTSVSAAPALPSPDKQAFIIRHSMTDFDSDLQHGLWARLMVHLRWTRSSSALLTMFLTTVALIVVVWWPLAEEVLALIPWKGPWWRYMDWLLLGIFLVMSALIVIGADLRTDLLIVFVGMFGGLVIESWGTQTLLWTYYTNERPPLWIIPAWPIASLSIDRLVRFLDVLVGSRGERWFRATYWLIFLIFITLMLPFVFPTIAKPMTIGALVLCFSLIFTPTDHRIAVLTFVAGSGLGYFLERWGTTRLCWTYYTQETPPLFAVLAHGMAAVAFWRASLLLKPFYERSRSALTRRLLWLID